MARFPGFSASLASTLGELRSAALDAALLADKPAPAPEIAVFLREYEARMNEARLADHAALFVAATAALGAEKPAAWLGLPLLLLDVGVDSEVEKDFVIALAAEGEALPGHGFRRGRRPHGVGSRRPSLPLSRSKTMRISEASSLSRLRRFLFASEQPPRGDGDDAVRFFSAPGEGRESVEIARRILAEARAGAPFDQMAVFLRAPETYPPLLETAFRRAGIPAYFARGTRRPDPAGRAFLALLRLRGRRTLREALRRVSLVRAGAGPSATARRRQERAVWSGRATRRSARRGRRPQPGHTWRRCDPSAPFAEEGALAASGRRTARRSRRRVRRGRCARRGAGRSCSSTRR